MTDVARSVPSCGAPTSRRMDLWYLVFLGSLLFQPLFDPSSGTSAWLVSGVAVALFVPLHIQAVLRPGNLGRWAPGLSVAIGLATLPFNGGAAVFFIYAASYAAWLLPRREALWWFAGLSLPLLGMLPFVDLPVGLALVVVGFPAVMVWMIGMMVLEDAEKSRAAERLRIDNARISHLATATERERLARDLHDLLGQSLTEVIVRAQLIQRLAEQDPARAREEAATVERSSRRALAEVRDTVRGWSELDLDEELEVARRTLEAVDVVLEVARDEGFDPPPTTETVLAQALREGVTNVVRHAEATRCRVDLRREGREDLLRLSDDGRGGEAVEGQGLSGMRARVLALGGSLERDGESGTTLTIRVPSGVAA